MESNQVSDTSLQTIKCVIVGDGSVGKTCMLVSYTTDKFPTEYVPTIFDNHSCQVTVDNVKINLMLMDTAGQEDYGEIRQLSYPQADVFIIVYSVIEPSSLENAVKKWFPELQSKNPIAKKIFAGNKTDLRDETIEGPKAHVKKATAEKVLGQTGCPYIECSALNQDGLKTVFDTAIRSCLKGPAKKDQKNENAKGCCNLI